MDKSTFILIYFGVIYCFHIWVRTSVVVLFDMILGHSRPFLRNSHTAHKWKTQVIRRKGIKIQVVFSI
jgi:hypothetical protein